ncbi:hypothetical protein I302_102227 [Kwoniella bestiolae CBS 10118]|uniref:Uncharacterized protein n=1 Tax=Kwoniella bestiolae CBS 10118 TaxID=1296100 RepID=A0A1B9GEL8_9TREE|nr:hypothetical protein I302_00916 [Kwoniella bestiolae CBS 10118]OCF29411.1 hypothetical protein I302_00916 [Kwoniella bestiolae CBS 10118]
MRTTIFFQKHVEWTVQALCTVLPLCVCMLFSLLIISPPTCSSLALYEIKFTVEVNSTSTIYEAFNFTFSPTTEVPVEILLGPGGGCTKFDDELRTCQRSLSFKPSQADVHLPSDEYEELMDKVPSMRYMIMHHMALGMVVLGIVTFWLGPFIPGFYFVSTTIMIISSIFTFVFLFLGDGLVAIELDDRFEDFLPPVEKRKVGQGITMIFGISVLLILSTGVIYGLVSRITSGKPPEEGDLETQDR